MIGAEERAALRERAVRILNPPKELLQTQTVDFGMRVVADRILALLNDLEGAETEARVARTLQTAAESREQQLLTLLSDLQERERTLRECVAWYAAMLPYMTRLDAYGQLTAGVIEDAGARARAALASTAPEES